MLEPLSPIPPPCPSLCWPLSDLRACDRAQAGGKAAALAQLVQAGLAVPQGMVLPADTLQRLGNDALALHALLDEVWTYLQSYGPCQGAAPARWAVRSSACCEDGDEASFAGQFETVLGVSSASELFSAVQRCRNSFHVERVQTYAAAHAPVGARVPGAVLIQQQIEARWAGVAFTADPESGIEQLTVVEGVPGLGEALVAGHAEPAYIRFDRRSNRIVMRRGPNLSEKARSAFDLLARKVIHLTEDLRLKFNDKHLDCEWAWDGRVLWILQARPLTTPTFPLPERRPLTEPELWFHGNFAETMPGPIGALTWDVVRRILPYGRLPEGMAAVKQAIKAEPVELIAGRVCWNLSFNAYFGTLNETKIRLFRTIDARMADAIRNLLAHEPLVSCHALPSAVFGRAALEIATLGLYGFWRLQRAFFSPERARREMADAGRKLTARVGAGDHAALSAREAWHRALDLMDHFLESIHPHIGTFYGLLIPLAWAGLAAQWHGQPVAEAAGALGAEASGTLRMDRATRVLGQALREAGVQAEDPPEHWPPAACAALAVFLNEFGHRGPGEQDLENPRFADDPRLAVELALLARAPDTHTAPSSEAEAWIDRIASTGLRGRMRAALLRWMLPRARKLAPVREDAKQDFWMPFNLALRRLLMRIAHDLYQRGALDRPEDIFLFKLDELDAYVDRDLDTPPPFDMRARAQQYQRQRAQWRRLHFPEVLRSDGVPVEYASQREGEGHRGVPVSSGRHEGRARVARNFDEARALQPGEVLVTGYVDPGWTPLFGRAGAVVLEVGGVLSHGAVVARELNLPMVAGLHGATALFQTGQVLSVDGHTGQVNRLDDTQDEAPKILS